ncbi:MAG TPA: carbon-nitrogen hydrolase family protein [Nocardioidaceae bacterium]|jgi:predicted amidohydrolase|nr:carbon-nitrogen hydrolase family protein [Nocardioidaceae bacterium]
MADPAHNPDSAPGADVVRVALVQTAAGTDSAAQRESVRAWCDRILGQPGPAADLVVLPEAVMHDFGSSDHDVAAVAEPLDGPFVSLLAEQAARLGAVVVAGMFERADDGGRPYNSLAAVGPDGSLMGVSRKVHMYDSFGYRESDRLQAGPVKPVVLEVGAARVGLMTCYDLRFPEYARLLVDAGADTLCVPAAWVRGPMKEDHWVTLLRARAIENTCWVLGAAQTGPTYAGCTQAVDPLGVVLAAAGDEEAVVRAVLDPSRLASARARNPALEHRRIRSGARPQV